MFSFLNYSAISPILLDNPQRLLPTRSRDYLYLVPTTATSHTVPRQTPTSLLRFAAPVVDDTTLHDSEHEYAIAMSDYIPQPNSTLRVLPFRAGQLIHVLNNDENGWWEGELDGRQGWFPSSYVNPQEVPFLLKEPTISSTSNAAKQDTHPSSSGPRSTESGEKYTSTSLFLDGPSTSGQVMDALLSMYEPCLEAVTAFEVHCDRSHWRVSDTASVPVMYDLAMNVVEVVCKYSAIAEALIQCDGLPVDQVTKLKLAKEDLYYFTNSLTEAGRRPIAFPLPFMLSDDQDLIQESAAGILKAVTQCYSAAYICLKYFVGDTKLMVIQPQALNTHNLASGRSRMMRQQSSSSFTLAGTPSTPKVGSSYHGDESNADATRVASPGGVRFSSSRSIYSHLSEQPRPYSLQAFNATQYSSLGMRLSNYSAAYSRTVSTNYGSVYYSRSGINPKPILEEDED